MKRRTLLKTTGFLATTSAFISPTIIVKAASEDPLKRIGMTSAVFRYQFTNPRHEMVEEYPDLSVGKPILSMKYYPEYMADRFGLHNLEYHIAHVSTLRPSYLKDVRKQIEKCRSVVTNVQSSASQTAHLASEDEEKRQESLARARAHIDAAVILGAQSIRINTGYEGNSKPRCLASFQELNRYAKERGTMILVEKHGGVSDDLDFLIQMTKIDPKNIFINPDFGHFDSDSLFQDIRKVFPYVNHQVCAKVMRFDENWNHTPYDFDRCVRVCEEAGFNGVYSGEQYDPNEKDMDYEQVADWIIEHVKANI